MIRLLKRFADWLDKRFPEKVVVTKENYDELHYHILALRNRTDAIQTQADKIAYLENTHVTRASVDELSERFHRQKKDQNSLLIDYNAQQEHIAALEKTVAALKDAMVKGGAFAQKSESDLMRAAFVRGEFGRLPTRAELESAAK